MANFETKIRNCTYIKPFRECAPKLEADFNNVLELKMMFVYVNHYVFLDHDIFIKNNKYVYKNFIAMWFGNQEPLIS